MYHKDMEETLKLLGLSEKQSRVYSALLELGIGSAKAVALRSDLKRSTTYVILDELIDLSLAMIVPRSKKKHYRALHPDIFLEKRKQELSKVEKKMPEIEAFMKKAGIQEKPTVMFFEGVDGIKEILNYKIEEMSGKTIYGFYATGDKKVQERFGYFKSEERKRGKLNIRAKGIAPDDPENLEMYRDSDKQTGREIVTLPKEVYSSNIAIEIGESWVKTNDFKNLQGLIIENPDFAKTMREIFDLLWKHLKKPNI